jgi:hypothetical protein
VRPFAILALLGLGCSHQVAINPARLPELSRFAQTGEILVNDGVREVRVTSEQSPSLELKLRRSCKIWQLALGTCVVRLSSSLTSAQVTGTTLALEARPDALLNRPRPMTPMTIELAEIESAALDLSHYVPDSWRPRWGIGIALIGPSGLAAWSVQFFARGWLALEAGVLPGGDVGLFYGGARLRWDRAGRLKPFVGGFANVGVAGESADGKVATIASVGPRAGLDLEIDRLLITAEFDLAHPLGADRAFFDDLHGDWLPWGGGAVAYLF